MMDHVLLMDTQDALALDMHKDLMVECIIVW